MRFTVDDETFLFKNIEFLISDVWMHLLAVQEVHDGLQDIVSLLDNAAVGWDGLSFDLGKDVPHLPDVVLDLGLETTSPHRSSTLDRDCEASPERGKETLPDGKDVAEVVHDAVELVLQLLEEVAGFHVQLEARNGNEAGTGAAHIHSDRCTNAHSRLCLPWLRTSSPAGL